MILRLLKQLLRHGRLRRARVLNSVAPAGQLVQVGDWTMAPAGLSASSVVYSFGVGDNVAWDLALIRQFGCTVHAFDPTPASSVWVRRQSLPPQFVFHDCGISDFDGELAFYPPRQKASTHYSQEKCRGGAGGSAPTMGRVQRLATIMRRLGHERIDVLKLDVEGSEFEALPDILGSGIRVQQLLVEIHYHFRSRSLREGLALIAAVKQSGMQCIHVSRRGLEFTFVRRA